jgi:hypothetical protein
MLSGGAKDAITSFANMMSSPSPRRSRKTALLLTRKARKHSGSETCGAAPRQVQKKTPPVKLRLERYRTHGHQHGGELHSLHSGGHGPFLSLLEEPAPGDGAHQPGGGRDGPETQVGGALVHFVGVLQELGREDGKAADGEGV